MMTIDEIKLCLKWQSFMLLNHSISQQSKLTNLTKKYKYNMTSNNLNTNSYFDENEKVFSFEEKNSSNFHK